jgi:hypothetical protein
LKVAVLVPATLLGLGIAACTPGPDTSTVDDSGDADTDTDADSDTDSDTDTDTGTGRSGEEGQLGVGTMSGAQYVGYEEWYFAADEGAGADVCRIRYTLTSTAPLADCAECSWAYDMVLSVAQVLGESDPGCLPVLGYDSATVGSLDGTTVSYGYSPSYYGHAQVLMIQTDGVWDAATFATFDDATGEFTYDWEKGYREY